jgi:hypothetical protein
MAELTDWANFYVIVGSGAAALIGLQFIFVTLIASLPGPRTIEVGAAFATPTIVHFSVVLLVSSLISAPWESAGVVAALWALVGVGGILYIVVVIRMILAQAVYKPVKEDWLFHVFLPFAAYATLLVTALTAHWYLRASLFLVGGSMLTLIFVGIHNSWDAVAYNVFKPDAKPESAE